MKINLKKALLSFVEFFCLKNSYNITDNGVEDTSSSGKWYYLKAVLHLFGPKIERRLHLMA
jgi:hypothetical protein